MSVLKYRHEKMKIAYVGFGKSTNRYHIPYLQTRDNFEIVRIVTPTLMKNPEAQLALEATGTLFRQTFRILSRQDH